MADSEDQALARGFASIVGMSIRPLSRATRRQTDYPLRLSDFVALIHTLKM